MLEVYGKDKFVGWFELDQVYWVSLITGFDY
jgi:hypothetical protein